LGKNKKFVEGLWNCKEVWVGTLLACEKKNRELKEKSEFPVRRRKRRKWGITKSGKASPSDLAEGSELFKGEKNQKSEQAETFRQKTRKGKASKGLS